ncbi:MAG: phage tail assembly chaperone [Desulfovibrio sp.]|uniref:phage tail assembly chaperone n=1 Tax=Desulfovibrio sp. TaxID=885 RepID=UPI0039E69B4D
MDKITGEPGKITRRVNDTWTQVENHKGKKSFIGRPPHTIDEYGPLPDGFTETLPPLTAEELLVQLRMVRDWRLYETDKYVLPDFPISTEKAGEIKAYRNALRDLPSQPGSPGMAGELTPCPELPSVG